ncbi:rhodanese-like domain-containing protein [Herbidospora sp. NEAU-GS84]|uniref:Rhodanese-like domain-containing protein n=1 Tax=Herbidospora solisilvae TaxID=2696284 RepID=A0A7C9JF39_9ACTN|nr:MULTISPECIES: rhodanese-like domain-containing protein [Herbidospora]NAS23483.1 rhodanese-like domain-containing protein [Herbidospora solisilvae]
MSESVKALIAQARAQIDNLPVDEVAKAVEAGGVTLVDLREPGEVEKEGTIPGAVLAPRGMLEFYADPSSPYHRAEFDPAGTVILFCASGGRSALAARTLQSLGYQDVAHLDGGLKAWKDAGRPTTHEN